MTDNTPSAFISYSWDSEDHKAWVRELATRLRSDGIETKLDQWEVVPGDQLPQFMEEAVRNSDYVLIICTPRYKNRSDNRLGGVGYEGDIMTAHVMSNHNQRKFIPILREGTWLSAAATWLLGKYYVDLSDTPYTKVHYQDLLATMLGTRVIAPPVAPKQNADNINPKAFAPHKVDREGSFDPITIIGVVVDEVGKPRNDNTPGSALYKVPFRLSKRPTKEWADLFIAAWDHPPRFTTMHRPGTASITGDKVYLNRTTIEEVEKYHRETLILATKEANKKYQELLERRRTQEQAREAQAAEHQRHIDNVEKRISFDDSDFNS